MVDYVMLLLLSFLIGVLVAAKAPRSWPVGYGLVVAVAASLVATYLWKRFVTPHGGG